MIPLTNSQGFLQRRFSRFIDANLDQGAAAAAAMIYSAKADAEAIEVSLMEVVEPRCLVQFIIGKVPSVHRPKVVFIYSHCQRCQGSTDTYKLHFRVRRPFIIASIFLRVCPLMKR